MKLAMPLDPTEVNFFFITQLLPIIKSNKVQKMLWTNVRKLLLLSQQRRKCPKNFVTINENQEYCSVAKWYHCT